MRRYRFDRAYLRDFAQLDSGLTQGERDALDRAMAAIVRNPAVRSRVQSFYDPDQPSWLVRSGSFVVHYTYEQDADEVIFLNLFRRR